jgi:hypothetical protein
MGKITARRDRQLTLNTLPHDLGQVAYKVETKKF